MCLVSAPKTAAQPSKDVPVLRNPYLDGINPIIAARSTGLHSLRIDRDTAGVQNPSNPTASPLVTTGSSAAQPSYGTPVGSSPMSGAFPRLDFSSLRLGGMN